MGVSNASFPYPPLKSKEKMCRSVGRNHNLGGSAGSRKRERAAGQRRLRHLRVIEEESRQVRFNEDKNNVVEIQPTCDVDDDNQKENLWWTKAERRDILETNYKLASDFRHHHQEQVRHCKDVFAQCCDIYEDDTYDEGDDEFSSDDDDNDDDIKVHEEQNRHMEQARIDLPTHVRGLEWGIVPASKAHRKTHVQTVLKAQEILANRPSVRGQMKANFLSTRAIRSSRPSRVLARIMGSCDATATKGESGVQPPRRNRCRMLPSWWC